MGSFNIKGLIIRGIGIIPALYFYLADPLEKHINLPLFALVFSLIVFIIGIVAHVRKNENIYNYGGLGLTILAIIYYFITNDHNWLVV